MLEFSLNTMKLSHKILRAAIEVPSFIILTKLSKEVFVSVDTENLLTESHPLLNQSNTLLIEYLDIISETQEKYTDRFATFVLKHDGKTRDITAIKNNIPEFLDNLLGVDDITNGAELVRSLDEKIEINGSSVDFRDFIKDNSGLLNSREFGVQEEKNFSNLNTNPINGLCDLFVDRDCEFLEVLNKMNEYQLSIENQIVEMSELNQDADSHLLMYGVNFGLLFVLMKTMNRIFPIQGPLKFNVRALVNPILLMLLVLGPSTVDYYKQFLNFVKNHVQIDELEDLRSKPIKHHPGSTSVDTYSKDRIMLDVVFTPLYEDILYRGGLFFVLHRYLGLFPSILLSASAFALSKDHRLDSSLADVRLSRVEASLYYGVKGLLHQFMMLMFPLGFISDSVMQFQSIFSLFVRDKTINHAESDFFDFYVNIAATMENFAESVLPFFSITPSSELYSEKVIKYFSHDTNMRKSGKLTFEESIDFLVAFFYGLSLNDFSTTRLKLISKDSAKAMLKNLDLPAGYLIEDASDLKDSFSAVDDYRKSAPSNVWYEIAYAKVREMASTSYPQGMDLNDINRFLLLWSLGVPSQTDRMEAIMKCTFLPYEIDQENKLNILDSYYRILQENRMKSAESFLEGSGKDFVTRLAGRKLTPEDYYEYERAVAKFRSYTDHRNRLYSAGCIGMTHHAFDRWIVQFSKECPEAAALNQEWIQYFQSPQVEKTLVDKYMTLLKGR